jgi:hypothetical protein
VLFHCTDPKLFIRKRYYVLFLIPVFIVQVQSWYSLPSIILFSKIPPSASMNFVTRERTWRVARPYSVLYSEISLSQKPFGIGHIYIYTFLLRMADTMTSQNIDLSSWDILYKDTNMFENATFPITVTSFPLLMPIPIHYTPNRANSRPH